MAMMQQYNRRADDRAGLRNLLHATTRRLQELEQKAAFYGASSDPALTMEIADLRLKVAEIEEKLRPPGQIPTDVWESMTPDDQRRYLIALVMGLQADFSECRAKLNMDVRLWIVALVATVVMTQLIGWVAVLLMR